jgi:hypothetical protein
VLCSNHQRFVGKDSWQVRAMAAAGSSSGATQTKSNANKKGRREAGLSMNVY